MDKVHRSTLEWTLIVLILLVAAFLRFHDLGNIPRGLEHDEVATWHMVAIRCCAAHGRSTLRRDTATSRCSTISPRSLWPCSGTTGSANDFGRHGLACGPSPQLMRRLFGPLVGLSAAGLQATVLWAFFFNRLGLRLNQLPFLLCVALYCYWRGVELTVRLQGKARDLSRMQRDHANSLWARVAWFVAAGLLAGLCFYTYMSSRVVPLLFGLFALYLWATPPGQGLVVRDLWLGCARWRALLAQWWPLLICALVAALVMAPLAAYLLQRPADTTIPQREEQVDRPLQELRRGNPLPIIENAWALLKMWNVDGERYWQLNVSHRPVFVEPISGILFWAGAALTIWRWRDPRFALLALWIGLGMVPSLITSEAPSWPRTMLASPAALALPGLAVAALRECLTGERRAASVLGARPCALCRVAAGRLARWRRPIGLTLVALPAISIALTAALTYRDFLVEWPAHPRVRYAFQSSLTEALRYLDASAEDTPVVMSGLSPHDMDPWTERVTLHRRDLSIRWVDPRSALVVPKGDVARLIVLDITPLDPALAAWAGLGPEAVIAQGEVVPRGGTEHDRAAPVYYDPAYTVYRMDAAALHQEIADAPAAACVGNDPFHSQVLTASPTFGGMVRLAGYRWLNEPRAGATASLLTFWSALRTGPTWSVYGEPALRVFLHLLDREGRVVAAADVLGAAPDTWQPGDVIVQLHHVPIPREAGTYAIEAGWYVPPDGPRLAVDGVDAPGERIVLTPIEVAP